MWVRRWVQLRTPVRSFVVLLSAAVVLASAVSCSKAPPVETEAGRPEQTAGAPGAAWLVGDDGRRYYKQSATFLDVFDTVTQLTFYAESEEDFERLASLAHETFRRFHRLCDPYHAYPGVNNIYTINERAGAEALPVEAELFDLLTFAKEGAALTKGRVNPAFGSVLALWHDAWKAAQRTEEPADSVSPTAEPPQPQGKAPSPEALRDAALHVDPDKIQLDAEARTVRLLDPDLRIDLGAVAKGYATERTAQLLQASGLEAGLISAGGNVRSIGRKPDGGNWRIAIRDPNASEMRAKAVLRLEADGSVVTSGDYERYFYEGGTKYHHIIDPETLEPGGAYPSVTVVTRDSGLADLLSTAFFLADPEASEEIRTRLRDSGGRLSDAAPDGLPAEAPSTAYAAGAPEIGILRIGRDGRLLCTPDLEGRMEITGE